MKKRRNSSKKRIALLLIVVCLIIAGIVFVITRQNDNNPAPKKPVAAKVVVEEQPLNELIVSISKQLLAKYPDLATTTTDQTPTTGYRVNHANFTVALPLTNALSFMYNDTSSESGTYSYLNSTLSTLTKTLSAQGYGGPTNATPNNSILDSTYFYQSKDNVCEVTVYSLLDITCASMITLSSVSNESSPFVNLYLATQVSVIRPTILSLTASTTSKTPGYETAIVNFLNGSVQTKAYYYRQTGASWQMVNLGWFNDPNQDGDITPNCQDFDSLLATREAFKDLACYSSTSRYSSYVN
jgi:hypothetical protein